MSIRYKFRSSLNFDTVEIGNRASISIAELRARILRGKASEQQRQGLGLVFSDAFTGEEYMGDDSQIPSGSSVIVRRVPGGTVQSAALPIEAVKHVGMKESDNLNPANGPKEELDVLGAGLSAAPETNFPDFNQEFDQNNFMGNKKDEVAGLRLPTSNFPALLSTNVPLELKCSLCNNFFKDAVMIPCCQHSFCEKCIGQVLIEKAICPKCFSSRCSVGDLLPNLSLRQAIEHFLESQMLDADSETAMQKYVPDGESGIQGMDVSCTLTGAQRELGLPQDGMQGVYPHHNYTQREPEDFSQSADFQGENQPILPQAKVHEEADSNINRSGGFWIESGGGGRNVPGLGGLKKGVRNCYTCGSPDHLMRDCPVSQPNPLFQQGNGAFYGGMPGFAQPFWNGYANMYSNPAMMPFNASVVPVSPFAVPSYMPGPGGNMTLGNMGPPCSDRFGLQHCGNKRKHPNENLERDQFSDNKNGSSQCYRHNGQQKSHDFKLEKHKEQSLSHSDDSLAQGSGRKGQHDEHMHSDVLYADERHEKGDRSSFLRRDKKQRHVERSNLAKEDISRSSDRDGERRHKHHHGGSGFEPSTPADRRAGYEERDTGCDSPRHPARYLRERRYDDRRRRVNGSDDDRRDEYWCHKRRSR